MRQSTVAVIVAVVIGMPSRSVEAQREAPVEPGTRIRVSTVAPPRELPGVRKTDSQTVSFGREGERPVTLARNGHKLVGVLVEMDDEAVTLILDGREELARVLRRDITRIEVSRPPKRGKGAVMGAALGLFVGLLWGASEVSRCEAEGKWFCEFGYVLPAATVPVGAALGALAAGEGWKPVAGVDFKVAITPAPGGGVGAQVSLGF